MSALVFHEGGQRVSNVWCVTLFVFSVSGAFDVDSTLDFDLDHIAGVGGLPPDVTSGTDLLAVSGLGAGDSSVDIDMTGSQSKI